MIRGRALRRPSRGWGPAGRGALLDRGRSLTSSGRSRRAMHETRTLARFVAETRFTDLPRQLVENLTITILDTLGAALVGTRQPWAQHVIAVARTLGGPPEATVVHQGWRTDVARTAFANGVLIGAFECEPLTGSHASGTVLPAALAVCERERLGGAAFLAAVAVGF